MSQFVAFVVKRSRNMDKHTAAAFLGVTIRTLERYVKDKKISVAYISEAARISGLSVNYLTWHIKYGNLNARKLGQRQMIYPQHLDNFLNSLYAQPLQPADQTSVLASAEQSEFQQ